MNQVELTKKVRELKELKAMQDAIIEKNNAFLRLLCSLMMQRLVQMNGQPCIKQN